MNKKEYEKPAVRVVKIAMTSIICTSGDTNVTNVDSGDTGIGFGGGGSGPARARQRGDWDVWDDWEE